MSTALGNLARRFAAYVRAQVVAWRSGSNESQVFALLVLLACVSVSFIVSWNAYELMPLTAYFVWLLVGMLPLRFAPLVLVAAYVGLASTTSMVHEGR